MSNSAVRCRTISQHLNDLKKENFSLKLRIYFLEEKIQQKFEHSDDDVHKRNIELKVEVESLKKDLEEKQQLLDKTLSTAEQLSNQNEAELQRHLAERQQEISHMQEILETKVQLLQEEAELARVEAEHMASLADSEAQRRLALERELVEKTEERGDEGLKDRVIEELREQKLVLDLQVEELQTRVHSLSSSLKQRDQEVERRVEEQQHHLGGLELQEPREQARNQELQLHSAEEEAQRQERNIQNICDSLNTREEEAAELLRVIEEQNAMLCSLKDAARRSQLQAEGGQAQGEVLALQASLFRAQLQLQAGQRARRRAARTQEQLRCGLQRLEADLQGALQHHRDAERHNQELRRALQKLRSALLEREEQRSEAAQERQSGEEQEDAITHLRSALLAKDQLIQELLEDGQESREGLLLKLRLRIRERDRALQRAVDEKFHCMNEREEESRRLQLLVRETERDAARQRGVLAHNEETITSLEVLLRSRSLELQQVRESYSNLHQQQQEREQRHVHALKERDAIIGQLQGALQAHTQETQALRSSLLPQVQSAPSSVLEELKLRLHLKDGLFQEVLADRAQQAQEHQEQVQELLSAISARDQYIQDSASRLGEVMAEQTTRLQELRQQLSSSGGGRCESEEVQALKEEMQVALKRSKENQELSRSQAAMLESLSRRLHVKEELIRDLQKKMVEPSDLPLVEQLTQEVQELQESLVQQGGPAARGPVPGRERPACGDTNSEDDNLNSQYADEDESRLKVQMKRPLLDVGFEGGGLTQLLQQKMLVETELWELKAQLEKAGFTSLSQMRKALFNVQAENTHLRHQLQPEELEDEDELDVTIEGAEEDEEEEVWDTWDGQISLSSQEKTLSQLLSSSSQVDADVSAERKSKDLREPLMVQVQVQAEQPLLAETTVQQDSKLTQVDLQDLGYETCGRSENEAEREDTSSPEFDDLEMCTSLDSGSQWWPSGPSSTSFANAAPQKDEASLGRLVDELRSQLSGSQALVRSLQAQLGSRSSSKDLAPSSARKVSWRLEAAPGSLSGAEEDEGWQSSSDAPPRLPRSDRDLQDLVSRVDALEVQLRKGGRKPRAEDRKWTGKFDVLIQTQARELSHLRQRSREAGGVCGTLSQLLGDTTRAFEELLRSNDMDFHMGQSFREQLAQSSALLQRLGAKISGRDGPEDPDEKTELLAIRLSKELQQKDKIIESLQARLNQHHHPHRSDTPCSSHALSDATDQLDRISYVSEDGGSTAEDLDPCSDVEAASQLDQDTGPHPHPSAPPAASSQQSWLSCPSVQLSSSPRKPSAVHRAAPPSAFASFQDPPPPPFFSSVQRDTLPPHPCCRGNGSAGFSLAEVHQELQMLQRQLGVRERFSKPLQGFQPPPFSGALDASSAMTAGAGLLDQSGTSALWEIPYGGRAAALGADVSSGSSGYQSGPSHTGSDLMKEHLREIRSLRQRLEDSISTNDRLRQQLEEKLARTATEKAGPTNIYIQGLDSVGQLSTEIRYLKEEKESLQKQLEQLEQACREGSKEAELLKEAVLRERAKAKEAELEAEKLAARSRKLQSEAEANGGEIAQLKHERQQHQEATNRLQHEVSVLQQQLCESRRAAGSLQEELQVRRGVCALADTHTGEPVFPVGRARLSPLTLPACPGAARTFSGGHFDGADLTFDPSELQLQLEQQLSGRGPSRRQQLIENLPSPPVRDTRLVTPPSPPLPSVRHSGAVTDDTASGWLASRHGRHAPAHAHDFDGLRQQLSEGRLLLQKMEAGLLSLSASQEVHLQQPPGSVARLLSDTKMLQQVLEEAQMFCRAAPATMEPDRKDQSLQGELASLRRRLSEQDQALKDAMERVKSSNRTKDNLENFIAGQLARTRDVLRKAKTNLQVNQSRMSTLHHPSPPSSSPSSPCSSSSSPPSPSCSSSPSSSSLPSVSPTSSLLSSASFSFSSPLPRPVFPPSSCSPPSFSSSSSSSSSSHLCPVKDKNSGGFCELTFSPDWSILRPWTPASSSSSSTPGLTPHQRPLQSVYL